MNVFTLSVLENFPLGLIYFDQFICLKLAAGFPQAQKIMENLENY